VRTGALDERRANENHGGKFAPLADFLESIPTICPHELFRREDGLRGSELPADMLTLDKLLVLEKSNAATDMAALVLPTIGTNHERHPKLQRFLLHNDSTTIAVEVPLWLSENEMVALQERYGIAMLPSGPIAPASSSGAGKPRHFTGHVDFLQVRNGAVHILDYKPDARTIKPLTQLTMYALALTVRVPGLKLFDIKCAWFNEERYNEFFPRRAVPTRARPRAGQTPHL
jgi:hypothetical protein